MTKVDGSDGTCVQKAKVALIGCGAVAEILYANALRQLEQEGFVSTVAVVDPNPARTASIAERLQGPRQFANLASALAEEELDLAIVATPHRFHADFVVKCLENSVSVLCEKPMATTTAECNRMIEAAQRAKRVLAVGHFRRFFPSCQMVKAIVSGGLLGRVRSFRVLEGETYNWPAQSTAPFKRSDAGGGVLIDSGAHTIDLLLWWFGDVTEFEYQDDAMGGVEANCLLRLQMSNGAQGIVQLSRDWPLPNRYVIDCEKGWLTYVCDVVDRVEWGLHAFDFGLDTQIRNVTCAPPLNLPRAGLSVPNFLDCFVNQLHNVLAAIRHGEPALVSGTEARKTVALIESCYSNRKLIDMPWLPQEEIRNAENLAHV